MIKQTRKEFSKLSKDELVNWIINQKLNDFIREFNTFEEHEPDHPGKEYNKRIPYAGWYWRDVDFATGEWVRIANTGEFIGFCENNKWGYPQRTLTDEEFSKVVKIIERAYKLNSQGGILAEIWDNTRRELNKVWDLMQTFTIETSGFWIFGPQGNVGHAETKEAAQELIKLLEDAGGGLRYRMVPV